MADSRTLIRVASAVSVLMTLGRGTERLYARTLDLWSIIQILAILGSALALAGIAQVLPFDARYTRSGPLCWCP